MERKSPRVMEDPRAGSSSGPDTPSPTRKRPKLQAPPAARERLARVRQLAKPPSWMDGLERDARAFLQARGRQA